MTRTGLLLLTVFAAAGLASAAPQTPSGFDGARAYEHVRQLVAIGPRTAGSPGGAEARRYILGQLTAIGIRAAEQPFDAVTPLGPTRMANVVATLPGSRMERLVLAGHFDTKRFPTARFVGANDGGSSTAFLLELARVLRGRTNPYTIELLFFDGEEAVIEWTATDHTYGSRHYVEAARRSGSLASIRALILVDMIGDRDLAIRRESQSTPWLTDLIWASARRLGLSRHFLDEATPVDDDHVPFLEAGVPAVDVIDFDYPAWHTPADTIDQVAAHSLQIVGDVLLAALPAIEERLAAARQPVTNGR
jgi:Zn-dependent M28 family amino/carboxypeptidase